MGFRDEAFRGGERTSIDGAHAAIAGSTELNSAVAVASQSRSCSDVFSSSGRIRRDIDAVETALLDSETMESPMAEACFDEDVLGAKWFGAISLTLRRAIDGVTSQPVGGAIQTSHSRSVTHEPLGVVAG